MSMMFITVDGALISTDQYLKNKEKNATKKTAVVEKTTKKETPKKVKKAAVKKTKENVINTKKPSTSKSKS